MRSRVGVSPRKRPVQGRSEETVGYILEAAARLFEDLGYAGTTTNKVAELAGVSVGSLYEYFPNKDSILLVLAERHLAEDGEKVLSKVRKLAEQSPTPEAFVRGLVGITVEVNRNRPRLQRMIFEEAPRPPELVEKLRELEAKIAGEVERYLRRSGLGGEEPGLAAFIVVHAVEALVHDVVLSPPKGHSTESCVEAVVAFCLCYVDFD